MLRKFFISTFLCAALAAALPAQNAQIVIKDTWDSKYPVYKILVKGTPEAVMLAKKAFATHGSFKLDQNSPNFTLNIEAADAQSVNYSVSGGKANFAGSAKGHNFAQAVAKACDEAASKITGSPCYFSGKLAYVCDKTGSTEVYTSDFLFQNIRRITSDKSDSLLPHWSPDGNKILYTGYYRSGLMDLYEITLNPLSRRTFASYKGTNTGGAYSPDGSKVALILTSSGSAELWVGD
ncbi:MAG: PD40 domain-containing protein, partial [Opitutales bacterium]|nr:PD40 domain-containing protein [Opitutales bacterium]